MQKWEQIRLSAEERLALLQSEDLQSRIRNFCVIAHVDHGKSTLCDRLLEASGNIRTVKAKADGQVLDSLSVERERGITVKAQTASLFYRSTTGESGEKREDWLLNLIDTPGHVDFSYEVSRSLAACQGALLLVDATQGIQAQTLANYHLALESGLDVIPVLSKMDLPHADRTTALQQLDNVFGFRPEEVMEISSKTGHGIAELFPEIIQRFKPPTGNPSAPLRALLFDSWFDTHRGVICLINIVDGEIRKGDRIGAFHSEREYEVQEVGLLTPAPRPSETLRCGQVGYLIAGVKTAREVRLGETFFLLARASQKRQIVGNRANVEPLPGFKPAKSMVFAGIFAGAESDFEALRGAMEKLTLNDASVQVQAESSIALGSGYRCGFLGILHMTVFCERLEKEFGEKVIVTAPTVPYTAVLRDGRELRVESPAHYPSDPNTPLERFLEPMVRATIISPEDNVGPLMELCKSHRGELIELTAFSKTRVMMRYTIPLAEILVNFYDKLKSISSGYASFDYEEMEPMEADVVKLEIKLNGEPVDPLSLLCVRTKADELGRQMLAKLKKLIHRQNFEVIIQAAIGNRIIARERIPPYRKDVLTKGGKTVGGGDQTRKTKLLEKQKAGKKRLKAVGNIELDDSVFAAAMSLNQGD